MAQNFWTAICAFAVCFVVTVAVSLVTTARDEPSWWAWCTRSPRSRATQQMAWYLRPATLGVDRPRRDAALNVVFF